MKVYVVLDRPDPDSCEVNSVHRCRETAQAVVDELERLGHSYWIELVEMELEE